MSNPDSARFHKIVLDEIPAEQHGVIEPLVEVLRVLTEQIKDYVAFWRGVRVEV